MDVDAWVKGFLDGMAIIGMGKNNLFLDLQLFLRKKNTKFGNPFIFLCLQHSN